MLVVRAGGNTHVVAVPSPGQKVEVKTVTFRSTFEDYQEIK
jgi:hypothetical protein